MKPTTISEIPLKTLPQLARQFGVSERRATYAAKIAKIEPAARLGIIRLFDAKAETRLSMELRRIKARGIATHATEAAHA